MYDAVLKDGLLSTGHPVVVMFSGGRDSTCLLDLAVRIAGPGAVTAVHANYGLRGAADADERHCAEVCEALGVQLDVRRPVRPQASEGPDGRPGGGNLQAWARAERYRAATDLAVARGADVAAGHTRSDQVETILYRIASSPSRRALLGMRRRQGWTGLIRPLLEFTREQTAAYCAERVCAGARTSPTSPPPTRATASAGSWSRPSGGSIRPRRRTCSRWPRCCATRPTCWTRWWPRRWTGAPEDQLARLHALHPAVRRLVVQRLADGAAGRPAAGVARRAEEVAAMGRGRPSCICPPASVRG